MAVLSDQPPREPHLYRACTRAPQPSISISSWTPIPGVCSGHHGSQDYGSGALSQTAGGFHGPCMSLRITGVWGTVRALRSATPSKPPESSVGPAGGLRLSAGRGGGVVRRLRHHGSEVATTGNAAHQQSHADLSSTTPTSARGRIQGTP